MRSIRTIASKPTALPLSADDITEFHAARILLLLQHCGSNSKIKGLTKLAKLDFFVRYPDFFERASMTLGKAITAATKDTESVMVRHHYGPWDKRYYQVLSYLESRRLISVIKVANTFEFELTSIGGKKAKELSKTDSFKELVSQMKIVKKVFGRMNGTKLKETVYLIFDKEVKQRKLGEFIK